VGPSLTVGRRPCARSWLCLAGWCLLVGLANALAVRGGDPVLATGASLVALVLLPGLSLAGSLLRGNRPPSLGELGLAAGALGAAWLVLTSLALALLGFGLGPALLVPADLVSLGLPALLLWRGATPLAHLAIDRTEVARIAAILALAAPLRFVGLAYTEFHIDEAEVVLPALGLVQGLPDVLFYHQKGPAELLVTAAGYGIAGHLTEASAKLPFAVFNLLGVVGLSVLSTRWFGGLVGLVAGLLLAADGFFVAFAHIAQYQSLVLLCSMAALYFADRYRASFARELGWAVLAGLMIGVGTLAHYDALLAAPPVLALFALGIGRALADWRRALPGLVLAGLVGLLTVLLFFGPYHASPLFELAAGRIADRVGDAFSRDNLAAVLPMMALYLSTYFTVALFALAALGLIVGFSRPLLAARRSPDGPAPVHGSAAAALTRRVVALVALWAAVPLLAYTLVVRKPGTHIHVALEGLTVLAAVAVAAILAAPRAWIARTALAGVALLALGPVVAYDYNIFLLTAPEVLRSGLVPRYALYWQPGVAVPRKELFGFPYQAGWKAVGVLFADGTLSGSYDSNEHPQITHWYAPNGWRCTAAPRYYVIGDNVQDEIEPPRKKIAAEYAPVADITVQGQPKLHVYDHYPERSGRPAVYAVEDLGPRFDHQLSAPSADPGPWARGPVASQYQRVDADFGYVRLLGYRLYGEDLRPGGVARLDLFWLPVVAGGGYEPSVQLGRDAEAGDGNGPGCEHAKLGEPWRANRPFAQRASIPILATASPGRYPLLVAINSAALGGPLPIVAGSRTGDTTVELAQVDIRP
jgi:hypothetical protein